MLFAFDFSGAMTGAIVGGIIGGLAGLIIWVIRRSTNKLTDDDDKPR